MLLHLFLLAALLPSSTRACTETIKTCDVFSEEPRGSLTIPTEDDVAKDGHWGGLKPLAYHLAFNFVNLTHHTGSVKIELQAVKSTDKIYLNQDAEHLAIDYKQITLDAPCQTDKGGSSDRCISKVTYVEKDQTLVLEFKNFQLQSGDKYTLNVPSFNPTSKRYSVLGQENNGFQARSQGSSTIMSTHFQTRYARTAFPCMDHVALKSVYHVCMEHPSKYLAASNTVKDASRSKSISGDRLLECFEPTPSIVTSLLVIAHMKDYEILSADVPGESYKVVIYTPISASMQDTIVNVPQPYKEVLEIAPPAIKEMTKITNFKFPMKRFGFVVVPSYGPGGTEHMGLITLSHPDTYPHGQAGRSLIYHEIVHMWIGDLFTISHWKEMCLQEGLTTYFEYRLFDQLEQRKVSEKRDKGRKAFLENDQALLYDYTKPITNAYGRCYGAVAYLFWTIEKQHGPEILDRYLAKLVQKRPYGTADIGVWDETLGEASDGKLKGFIMDWFTIPGPIYLKISPTANSNEILVQQFILQGGKLVKHSKPMPLHVQVETFQASTNPQAPIVKSVSITEFEQKVQLGPYDTFLVDPDGQTMAIKLYTPDQFLRILKRPELLIPGKRNLFIVDFCVAYKNYGSKAEDKKKWDEVMREMEKKLENVKKICK